MLHLCPQNTSCMIPPCPSQPRLHMSPGNPRSAARSHKLHKGCNPARLLSLRAYEPLAAAAPPSRPKRSNKSTSLLHRLSNVLSVSSSLQFAQGRVDLDRLLQRRELAMDWIVDEFGRWCTHPTDGETLCSELQIVSCLACTSGQIQIVSELTQDYSFWDR